MYVKYNPHPYKLETGDCVIRALVKALDSDWDTIYLRLMILGYQMKNFPDYNHVWGAFLLQNGFKVFRLPDVCPDCYTIKDFCDDNPIGTFVLGTGYHVVCVVDGNYYDTSDSGSEVPAYVFAKGD